MAWNKNNPIRPGQRIPADAVNAGVYGAEQARQTATVYDHRYTPIGRWKGKPKRMRLKSVSYDYIVCRILNDSGEEGETDIKVAKPEELQKTPWDGKTIASNAYTVTGTQAVTVVNGATTENWVVIPTYQVAVTNYSGSVIFAIEPEGGTGVTVDDVPVTWQDLNVAARAWSKSS